MIMPRCTVHTIVCLCVSASVCQILDISMSSELEVLKVGQHANSSILMRFDC